MQKLISKTELECRRTNSVKNKKHCVGEIYPEIFDTDAGIDFKNLKSLDIAIIWLGGYCLDNNILPKIKCPNCGKEKALIPYMCGGSILSGGHIIKYRCKHCDERFVTNDHIDCFRLIYKYILNNQKTLKRSERFKFCTRLHKGTKFMPSKKIK